MILTKLNDLKGIHTGKPGIIAGAGYSLDLYKDNMPDGIWFACNQAVTTIKECDYFCMSDGAIPETNYFDFGVSISKKVALFGGGDSKLPPGVLKNPEKDKFILLKRDKNSWDFNGPELIWGSDVCQIACNFAHQLGCSPLILIGIDLNYKDGKKYCNPETYGNKVRYSEQQGFGNNLFYSRLENGADDPDLNNSMGSWHIIKQVNPGINFQIVNPESRLTGLFPVWRDK